MIKHCCYIAMSGLPQVANLSPQLSSNLILYPMVFFILRFQTDSSTEAISHTNGSSSSTQSFLHQHLGQSFTNIS